MSGMPLETCWAFNKGWNNIFYYKIACYWLFLQIQFRFHFILCPHTRFRSTLFRFVPPTKHKHAKIQGEHKVFPWLQTFITRRLRGIQKEHILKSTNVLLKKLLELRFEKKVCIPRSFLVINVCNQGKTLCSPCIF